jgi:signal transduction histidine kinase
LPKPWDSELAKLDEVDTLAIQLNGSNKYKCYRSYFINRGVKQSFFIIEELTKELLKAEKQSYEKVIRMMSHEVNNSVGAVNSIIDSTITYLGDMQIPENKEYKNVLHVAKERIINLNLFTRRLADIVHIPEPKLSTCNLTEVIKQVLMLFHVEFEQKKIKVTTQYESDKALITFDHQQLELVLINIIKNASQAMDAGGAINIYFRHDPPTLTIENSGEPIPEDIRKRLFEPFFTTKKSGQGIGLTLIREILMNHSCDFSLKTRDDGITEFQIIFAQQKLMPDH